MISVPYPHMVLNSHNAPGVEYKMWNTWKVPKHTSVDHMVNWIYRVAQNAPGGCLSTLIFNSHGNSGRIKIGSGIGLNDVTKFNLLRGLVDRIWITACKVALMEVAGTKDDGNYFCYRLAQESGAFVRASKDTQWTYPDLPFIDEIPYGFIDEWEGTVFTWNPKGEVISSETN